MVVCSKTACVLDIKTVASLRRSRHMLTQCPLYTYSDTKSCLLSNAIA